MPTIKWLTLEIGYESLTVDTCADKPDLQDELEKILPKLSMLEWALGSLHVVKSVATDKWVAGFLENEINAALKLRHKQSGGVGILDQVMIEEGQLCGFMHKGCKWLPKPKTPRTRTGTPGTRCKLRGKIWVNSRSYVLLNPDGKLWLKDSLPESSIPFAKLTWECHAVDEANLAPTVNANDAPKSARKR
jgi:hypothetical protein